MEPRKYCSRCKIEKPESEFYLKRKSQRQSECKECTRERRSLWWKSPAGKISSANSKLKARFGITLDEYNKLLDCQDRKCAVCGATESYLGHRLAVDHSHITGKVRGLLCKACNVGIGHFNESTRVLENAINYIIKVGH